MWIACYWIPAFSIICERAAHPELDGVPVALHDDGNVLSVVSSEAAAAGVRAGQTMASARIFCPHLVVRPYRRETYLRMAEPLWDRLACDSSQVEPVSPEISLAALTGSGILQRAQEVREDLRRLSKTAVQMGVALSRFTAQMAALFDVEETGVLVEEGRERELLTQVPVEYLPNLSKEERERFRRLGICVLGDLVAVPEEELYRAFRERSILFRRWSLGQDRDPVRPMWPPDCEEHTISLECGITEEGMLHEAIRRCSASVSQRLAERGRRCRAVTLMLRSERGRTYACTELLQAPEAGAEALLRTGLRLLRRMVPFPEEPPVSVTLRVRVAESCGSGQIVLFDETYPSRVLPHERRAHLEAALNHVRERFGQRSVLRAERLRRGEAFRLWTYPLGRRVNERIEVRTDSHGMPLCYRRRGRWWEVTAVQNRWAEAGWQQGRMEERVVYRVETSTRAVTEIRRRGNEWRLTAVAD